MSTALPAAWSATQARCCFSKWSDRAVDDWDKMIDTNPHGFPHAGSAVLPGMIARRSGHIVNLSSVAGIRVGDARSVHSATKFFIHDMTDSLRQEVGTVHGIRVSMIIPGVNDTGWAYEVCNAEGKQIAQDRSGCHPPGPRDRRRPTPSASPPTSQSTASSSTPPSRTDNATPSPVVGDRQTGRPPAHGTRSTSHEQHHLPPPARPGDRGLRGHRP
ncbi:SDR family NAD(P)-dependent oxidoreductase [Streptomyces sp. NPDC047042]|uniref:SDR family oxidoreductase n=1 Tax=Streptomyces sp. NPDC047042 TaxID=3154807 RepID=UPI0033E41A9B